MQDDNTLWSQIVEKQGQHMKGKCTGFAWQKTGMANTIKERSKLEMLEVHDLGE